MQSTRAILTVILWLTTPFLSAFGISDAGILRWSPSDFDKAVTVQAVCGWQPGFYVDDLDQGLRALSVFDDGGGPALFAGGGFSSAGEVIVNQIAKWDGTEWSALGSLPDAGVNGQVTVLAVYDDGTGHALYAGGNFTTAGGVAVNRIAKWDGTEWSALSGPSAVGANDEVIALAVYDDGAGPALYAGGAFTTVGGVAANYIAKWDGTEWSAVGSPTAGGVNSYILALAVHDDGSGSALYAAGYLTSAGGVTVDHIAKWDGTEWSALSGPSGVGTSSEVRNLAVYDDGAGPALYAGGRFATAGGVTVHNIAKWDGTAWSALSGPSGFGTSDSVKALAVYDDGAGPALIVGGDFAYAGGVHAVRVAKWDGAAWSALIGPSGEWMDSGVAALAVYDDGTGNAMYAGGSFSSAGGVSANRIAKWDGTEWSALSEPEGSSLSSLVRGLTVYDDGAGPALYAGGAFTTTGGVTLNRVAKWDGAKWLALSEPAGAGMNNDVWDFAVIDEGTGDALYAGGEFTTADGVTVNRIAKWDGSAWSPLSGPSGTGVSGAVFVVAAYDDGAGPALHAGGEMVTAGGVTVNHIARWDGTEWSALSGSSGIGTNNKVYALAVYDDGSGDALYVGGRFTAVGGIAANYIARWDGTEWSALSEPVGGGLSDLVRALAVFDDGTGEKLYAGGDFVTADGVTVNGIAKWDGTAWSPVGAGPSIGVDNTVRVLAVHDDGTGESLYAGGQFIAAGGVTVNRIARLDGMEWSALGGSSGTGTNDVVYALAMHDDGRGQAMFAGGSFTTAGEVVSKFSAKWVRDPVPPTDPTALLSPTHTSSTWSGSNLIVIEWTGAADTCDSGLDGYSILFDTSPTTSLDPVVDVPHTSDPHSTVSDPVADGTNHWFHLRTCDGVGNCSDGRHLGPFWIDTTQPGVIGDLGSTSHTIKTPSNDVTIDAEWTPAYDALSGVEGYGVEYSTSATWTCDQIRDVSGTNSTSGDLGNGDWYVHVCAVDAVGNWGDVVSAGPYVVDGTPPTVLDVASEGETADGHLNPGELALAAITQLMVHFSEAIFNPGGDNTPGDLTNPDHYRVLDLGPDRILSTADCSSLPAGDDVDIPLPGVSAWPGDQSVSIHGLGDRGLRFGRFALLVCGLRDPAGNEIAAQWTREFAVSATNLLQEPNFDASLSDWDLVSPDASDILWADVDPSSPTSGVVIIDPIGDGAGKAFEITQCLDVTEGTPFGLAGIAKIESTDTDFPILSATVQFFLTAGCTGQVATIDAVVARADTAGTWGPRLYLQARVPPDAHSARVGFIVEGGEAVDFTVYLDEAQFFEDMLFLSGFETGGTTWWSTSQP